ncbi:hypothetical protein NC652_003993 [Populus alba x Populus x berolinensis]|nr:hypothetical protein NC652_003993 [Populus alba x Populus x berolinensis]
MPYHFLSNSPSTPTTKASDRQNDTSVSLPSTSTSSSISPDMLNYLWIPFLISLSKELTIARSATATTSLSILLPSQLADDSPSAPRCPAPDKNLNYRPVIGILSHPGDGASGRLNNATNASYIAASYVKFVESAGARVIPLIYNEPREILFEKLNLINGVLFTGGWAKTGLYFDTAKAIFKEVLARNDAGFHFPVYAICLGFEILTMIISEVIYGQNICIYIACNDQTFPFQLFPYFPFCQTDSVREE